MKRTTKAILIFIALCLVLSIAGTIFGLYNDQLPEIIVEESELL